MIDPAAFSAPVQAGAHVGAVLLESIVLYAGYGALKSLAWDRIIDAIEGA